MATSIDYIEFVCEEISGTGDIRYKKMFGEYMVYVNDKPLLLICDSTVYVKKLDVIEHLMEDADTGIPYNGAKEHYILDVEEKTVAHEVIRILEAVIKVPKTRKKKVK